MRSDPDQVRGNRASRFYRATQLDCFYNDSSLKAISQGVPVVVRYNYDPDSKMLYYSELLLDPYHTKSIEQFLADKSFPEKRE